MNNNGSPASSIAPTLDLQALLATMPEFSMMNNLQNNLAKDRPTTEASIPTTQSLLFPPIPNDQLAALSLGLFPLSGFPMFPLLPMGPMSSSALPPHSTIESLGLMTNLRQSTSATSLAPPTTAVDTRPRAFSSAAALQRPKQATTPERRRKRSRKTQEEENEGSVLRMLMNEEDDAPIKIRQQAPTKDLDEKLRQDAAKGEMCSEPAAFSMGPGFRCARMGRRMRFFLASVLSASSPPPAKRASPDRLAELIEEPDEPSKFALRRIIRDEDLPDSIGPDSPFRHHPKYQKNLLRFFPSVPQALANEKSTTVPNIIDFFR
ncbi:hypothetical protein OESDEN_22917 [Oesophagostomum dentatum]|uniref:Uncharacterized protein n=1 Tax=Oesophagostomum dentatum TaxID=61180 RepID=A0A0B1RWK8_OESDE|nr:hypothetical protein OESDEN_22917 [Oesophagostomum dentatum]